MTVITINEHGQRLSFDEPQEDGPQLMEDLISYCREYVGIGEDEYVVWAAWVLHCHAFDAFEVTPYIHVTSPVQECGKTQLQTVSSLVVPNPIPASSCTEAVLARAIEHFKPAVIFIDEMDKTIAGDKDFMFAVMKTINLGYKRGGVRLVNQPVKGGGWEPKMMTVFCPKMLLGISSLPADTESRCIPFHMERLAPGEKVSHPFAYIIGPKARKLYARVAKWSAQHISQLARIPDCPPGLGNRQFEISIPLFAVADAVSGVWSERVRAAVLRILGRAKTASAGNINVEALDSVREAFGDESKMASQDIIDALNGMEDRAWAGWNKGKGITKNNLAGMLRKFGIESRAVRIDKRTPRGYHKSDFLDAWNRYLPPIPPNEMQQVQQVNKDAGETHISEVQHDANVALQKSEESPVFTRVVAHVALLTPDRGVDGAKPNGKAHAPCYVHPLNKSDWWTRPDGFRVCGKCHPEPETTPETSQPMELEAGEPPAIQEPDQAKPGVAQSQPEMITRAQSSKLHVLFKGKGRDERLRLASQHVGRQLSTSNELTKVEAMKLIDALIGSEMVP